MNEEILLKIKNISKQFTGTLALDNVSFEIKKGEVHALCGENGAGKSTLMNIIGGIFPPTSGELLYKGEKLSPRNPGESINAGIGFVHQELNLCEHLTAAENIYIGRLPRKRDKINFNKLYEDSDEVLSRLGANFSSKSIVSDLTVSEQQLVEIAKSLSLECQLLILDEPTSSLTDNEADNLFKVVKKLRADGISIIYISHRMAEVFELCDSATILKDGQYVDTYNIADIDTDDIIRAMVGRELGDLYPAKSSNIDKSKEILKVRNLSGKNFKNINFELNQGEILGFAGLVGAGRSEVMMALCGVDKKYSGEIFLNGEKQNFRNYSDAVEKGVCYLTEDRKNQGIFADLSIKKNMASANLKDVSKGIWIKEELENKLAENYVEDLSIKVAGIEYPISSLSGGNQQKCLIGKWLSTKPKVIIMDEPTKGIDVGSKSEIHNLLRNLANDGVGVIIISSELPEVIGVSDRVIVLYEGRVSGEITGTEDITEENLMTLASGESL